MDAALVIDDSNAWCTPAASSCSTISLMSIEAICIDLELIELIDFTTGVADTEGGLGVFSGLTEISGSKFFSGLFYSTRICLDSDSGSSRAGSSQPSPIASWLILI